MTFSISIDTARWQQSAEHAAAAIVAAGGPDCALVPVIKGRGYGLGAAALAAQATRLSTSTVAVGTIFEAAEALGAFAGDVVVLEPAEPRDRMADEVWQQLAASPDGERLVRTVASEAGWATALEQGALLGRPVRTVVEGLTSMHRFGVDDAALERMLSSWQADAVALEGLALHLPLAQPDTGQGSSVPGLLNPSVGLVEQGSARAREAIAWSRRWTELLAERLGAQAPDSATTVWASHLDDAELASVRSALPSTPMRARVGTRLWHGDRTTLRAGGTVLAVHRTDAAVGYRQRRGGKGGAIVVVSGGTSHGVALAAPSSVTSMKARISTAGSGALEAAGRARSPFTWQDDQLWFAEPPHVSVSLLRVPRGAAVPDVGVELPCQVRYTTTTADVVRWE